MRLEQINTSEAFRYLGYGKETPDDVTAGIAAQCESELLDVIDAKYIYRYFKIARTEGMDGGEDGTVGSNAGIVLEGTDMVLEGRSISEHLSDCEGLVMFAATLSEGVDRLIRRLSVNRMSAAVIADAMASAAVEQICDMAEQDIMKQFPDRYATWRFSPGYGDFPLESQRKLLTVIDAQKRIGVNITQGGLMTPCKSVTAVIGISSKEIDRKRRGCTICNMRGTCAFRRKGEHCGL